MKTQLRSSSSNSSSNSSSSRDDNSRLSRSSNWRREGERDFESRARSEHVNSRRYSKREVETSIKKHTVKGKKRET